MVSHFIKKALKANKRKNGLLLVSVFLTLLFFSSFIYAAQTTEGQVAEKQTAILTPTDTSTATPTEQKKNFSFLSSQTFSNTVANTKKAESSNSDALDVSLGLMFILLVIFSLAWFMKKMGYSNLTGQGDLKIIASLNLGHKEKIALIQVGKQQLLVGMTPTQINTLHVLDESIDDTDVIETKDQTGSNPFANKLSEFLKK